MIGLWHSKSLTMTSCEHDGLHSRLNQNVGDVCHTWPHYITTSMWSLCWHSWFWWWQVPTDLGLLSHQVQLEVLVPEVFILGQKDLIVDRGTTLSLVCIVENVSPLSFSIYLLCSLFSFGCNFTPVLTTAVNFPNGKWRWWRRSHSLATESWKLQPDSSGGGSTSVNNPCQTQLNWFKNQKPKKKWINKLTMAGQLEKK